MSIRHSFQCAVISVVAIGYSFAASAQGNNCSEAMPLTVNAGSCISTQVANTGFGDSGQIPLGANCNGYSGGDMWLSFLMPSSGEVTLTTESIPDVTPVGMDINMAVYSGTCGALTLITCDDNSATVPFAEATITGNPGDTYYIQLWEADNDIEGDFNICANGAPTCAPPEADFEVACEGDNSYNVLVNITSLGDASSVSVVNDGGAFQYNNYTSPGLFVVGPFDASVIVQVTVQHDEDAACDISESMSSNCQSAQPCDAALTLDSRVTFAESEVVANLTGAIADEAQCHGPGNNPARYFRFIAQGAVTYFRVDAADDLNPAIEVYDVCGGSSLACVNTAGAGQRELFWVTGLTPGQTYVYKVYHAGNGNPSSTQFSTAIAHIPVVQVRSDFCGAADLTSNSIIRATTPNPDFLLNAFVWEFAEIEAPFNTYEVLSPNGANPQFRMHWFAQLEFGRSYDVRVRARMYQGPNLGDWGPSCTITMAGEPITALRPEFNNGFFNMCSNLRAEPVPAATNYRWTFTHPQGTFEYNSNSGNNTCPLRLVDGLQLGTSYDVAVYATVAGAQGTTSQVRTIHMNSFVPETEINSDLFSCGSEVGLADVVVAVEVCSALSYTFLFTNITDPQVPPIAHVRPNRVLRLSFVPDLIPGHTYSVQVKASSGGLEGEFATACALTIEGMQGIVAGGSDVNYSIFTAYQPDLSLQLYPNPSTGDEVVVAINGLSEVAHQFHFEVFNLAGQRLVSLREAHDGSRYAAPLAFGSKLAPGAYLIRATVDGQAAATRRLIVQ